MVKKGLGKGLGSLLTDADRLDAIQDKDIVVELAIACIEPNPNQPRKFFDKEKLSDLADSIREHGVIQPIIVKRENEGKYSIIAGERRWRAAKMAGLRMIPSIIREYDEITTRQVALIENLQRENLNVIEEAKGYKDLLEEFGMTQDEISKKVSKSRPAVANALRLLNLPREVIEMIEEESLSTGQARAILGLEEEKQQIEVAEIVARKGLNVRQVEKLVADLKARAAEEFSQKVLDPYRIELDSIENKLTSVIGNKVRIVSGRNKGKIEIEYYSEEDLERLIIYMEKYANLDDDRGE